MQINVSEHLSSNCRFNIDCFNKSGLRVGCHRSRALIQFVVPQMSNSKGVSLKINHSTVKRDLTIGITFSVFELIVE